MRVNLIPLLLVLALPAPLLARNDALRYEGRLLDAADAPVTSASGLAMRFSLFPLLEPNAEADAVPAYDEWLENVVVRDGLLAVTLGATDDKAAELRAAFEENDYLFLEIAVGESTLRPRQEVSAAAWSRVAQRDVELARALAPKACEAGELLAWDGRNIYCTPQPEALAGQEGAEEKNEASCTARRSLAGDGVEVLCGGQLVAALADGQPGLDGTSCSIEDTDHGADIICGNDVVSLEDGSNGIDGASCSIAEATGGANVTCDGQTVFLKDGERGDPATNYWTQRLGDVASAYPADFTYTRGLYTLSGDSVAVGEGAAEDGIEQLGPTRLPLEVRTLDYHGEFGHPRADGGAAVDWNNRNSGIFAVTTIDRNASGDEEKTAQLVVNSSEIQSRFFVPNEPDAAAADLSLNAGGGNVKLGHPDYNVTVAGSLSFGKLGSQIREQDDGSLRIGSDQALRLTSDGNLTVAGTLSWQPELFDVSVEVTYWVVSNEETTETSAPTRATFCALTQAKSNDLLLVGDCKVEHGSEGWTITATTGPYNALGMTCVMTCF